MPNGTKFKRFKESVEVAHATADLVIGQLRQANRLLFSPAAGSTPTETDGILANRAAENYVLF